MLPSAGRATAGPLARLLARQRAHLLEAAAFAQQQQQARRTIAHYSPTAVSGPGGGGSGGGDTQPTSAAAAASSVSASLPPVKMRATTILAVRLGGEVVLIGDGQATANDFVVKPNVRKLRRLGPQQAPTTTAAEASPGEAAAATASASSSPGPQHPQPPRPRLSETAAQASPVVAGFAGLAADGLALLERLDAQVHAHPGQLRRACVELAKAWRQDRALRELDAAVLVADADSTLWLAGNGDVLESADGVVAVGSGSDFAEAAARALIDAAAVEGENKAKHQPSVRLSPLTALDVARRAMRVAADSCVYTNHRWTWFRLRRATPAEEEQEHGRAGAGAGGGAAPAQPPPPRSIIVEEGSEDGLLTSAPTHGGDL